MVKVREDLTGRQFGRLTVLYQAEDHIKPNGKHEAQWLCECSCKEHNKIIVLGQNLKKKNGTRSCGCIKKELLSELSKEQRKTNIYKLNLEDEHGLYGIGYTSNTENEFYFDMDDYQTIKDYCWYENFDRKNNYRRLVTRHLGINKVVKMSFVLKCSNYDHIDRNPLNNRRHNLRPATSMENSQNHSLRMDNTSGVIGVSFNKTSNKWQANITVNKKLIYLGVYADKTEAIKTRLNAEKQYFGEFAPQQHLYQEYGIG